MKDPFEIRCGRIQVIVFAGSITELGEQTDALVSSDDNYLTHGGGVSRALWLAAGPTVEKEAAAYIGRLSLGHVATTTAGRLNARHLLHAVTIDFDENRRIGPAEARALFGSVLNAAVDLKCTSLATPLLGTGAGRLDTEGFMNAAIEALEEFLDDPGTLRKVIFVVYGGDLAVAERIVERRLRGWEPVDLLIERAKLNLAPKSDDGSIWSFIQANGGPTDAWTLVEFFELTIASLLERISAGEIALNSQADPTMQREAKPPLGKQVRKAVKALAEVGRPVSQETTAALESFIMERNRLAHGATVTAAHAVQNRGVLWRGIRTALSLLAAEVPISITESTHHPKDWPSVGGRFCSADASFPPGKEKAKARRPHHKTPDQPKTINAVADRSRQHDSKEESRVLFPGSDKSSGTEHVRKFHAFLLETLTKDDLEDLQLRLSAQGYKGMSDDRLLEYCVQIEDPLKAIIELYKPKQLREAIQKKTGTRFGVETGLPCMARFILDYLKFPGTRRPIGLPTVLGELETYRSQLQHSSTVEVTGLVTNAAIRMERALRILTHSIVRAAFKEPAENFVRRKGWLPQEQSLDRCTLGSLLDILEKIDSALRESQTSEAFRVDFAATTLFPAGCTHLAALRNSFIHYKDETKTTSPAEVRSRALTFFDESIELLTTLRNRQPSLFPLVIEVCEIRIDRWGRRTVEAITDDGRKEFLFTDEPLTPGEVYFMYPLTNPFRVDPILQRAGELGSDQDRDTDLRTKALKWKRAPGAGV